MFWTSLRRIIRSGTINFRRAGTISLSSVLVVTVMLIVVGTIIFLQATLQTTLQSIRDRVDITVSFTTNSPEERILLLKNALEQLPEVKEVDYKDRTTVLADFRERHKNDYTSLRALDELSQNPFGGVLTVRANDPSEYETISNFLQEENPSMKQYTGLIERINYSQNKEVIDRLNGMISGAQRFGFILTIILAFISALITYNTIRLAIYISKEEIGIMKLVGAENKYIRGPFIVEGVMYGVIGTLITLMLFIPATLWAKHNMYQFLGIDLFSYYGSNFFQIAFILFAVGIFVSVLSSLAATRKYLKI
jgi:cell division transport system permease protein